VLRRSGSLWVSGGYREFETSRYWNGPPKPFEKVRTILISELRDQQGWADSNVRTQIARPVSKQREFEMLARQLALAPADSPWAGSVEAEWVMPYSEGGEYVEREEVVTRYFWICSFEAATSLGMRVSSGWPSQSKWASR